MKTDFKDYICAPFCCFYREGEKEEMACRGALVAEKLVESGILKEEDLPRTGKGPGLWEKKNNSPENASPFKMLQAVCASCPFREEDCDFQSKEPPPGCEPCGGYILLSLLLTKGLITKNNLKDIGY